MIKLPKTLPPPTNRPPHLPESVKWLSGEGAGSWFSIEETEKVLLYKVIRFSPGGKIECEGMFQSKTMIDLLQEYSITYPAHCSKVSVIQKDKKVLLTSTTVLSEIH